ncbi:hypothetical protein NIES39_A01360 [Arthrospira platensis NIES-39]|uniref:hypothetical protein n=2 Tax=Limnospira platensis TaxID=118562 RepID=UPI0001D0E2DB|nr:hypothetical protein NIES39_A01360 [Arthrospira platensis NIES-39]
MIKSSPRPGEMVRQLFITGFSWRFRGSDAPYHTDRGKWCVSCSSPAFHDDFGGLTHPTIQTGGNGASVVYHRLFMAISGV